MSEEISLMDLTDAREGHSTTAELAIDPETSPTAFTRLDANPMNMAVDNNHNRNDNEDCEENHHPSPPEENHHPSPPSPTGETARKMARATPPPSLPADFPPLGEDLQVEAEDAFEWKINGFSSLTDNKLYGPTFEIGGYRWKLLIYPRGNHPHEGQSLSLYVALDSTINALDMASSGEATPEGDEEESSANDMYCCAQVVLTVAGTVIPPLSSDTPLISKATQHRFDRSESDWGFGAFCSLRALREGDTSTGGRPLLQADDTLHVNVRLRIIRDETGILWHNFLNYNSKRVTGFVGLANQGATCYMNSLLQSLYFTNAFRKAIFLIPTIGDKPAENNALALQRIFWRLQHDRHAVSTGELTRAFGWDTLESFIQSDVQEFSRVLLDELESRMKGTQAEGAIERLFVGRVRNVIRCLNVPYESARVESFYDLQLSIKGLHTLEESFEAYVRAEMLTGDNRYQAGEGYGLQDAKRFVEFESFPPVLHLHLERYTFDPRVLATVKINDRLEFPRRLDLTRFLAEDSPQRKEGPPPIYVLQSVFVHSGDSHGGHYYVFIKDLERDSPKEGRWFRFDDTKVIPATEREAIEDNFGGDLSSSLTTNNSSLGSGDGEETLNMVTTRARARLDSSNSMRGDRDKYRKFTNAYMLVYIRETDLESVLCPVRDELDIPAHIGATIKAEQQAEIQRRAEKQQALTTTKVVILTPEIVAQHQGFDLFNFDNRNWPLTNRPLSLRVSRAETIATLKERIAPLVELPPNDFRLWTFCPRRNKTVRLEQPIGMIEGEEQDRTVGHYLQQSQSYYHQHSRTASTLASGNFVVFYLEKLINTFAIIPSVALGVKFYDPEEGKIKFLGLFYAQKTDRVSSLLPAVRQSIGLPPDTALQVWEEIKPGRIDPVDVDQTLNEAQLQTGDIIGVQLAQPLLSREVASPRMVDYFRTLQENVYVQLKTVTPLHGNNATSVRADGERNEEGLTIGEGEELMASRLPWRTPWSDLVAAIGEKLQVPSSHVRLHLGDELGEAAVALKAAPTLQEACFAHLPDNWTTEGITLWVEVTSIPVTELETMHRLQITLLRRDVTDQDGEGLLSDDDDANQVVDVYVKPGDTLATVLNDRFFAKSAENIDISRPVRLVEVYHHKVVRDYQENDAVGHLTDTSQLYLEGPLSAVELDPPSGHLLIPVFSYHRDPIRTHGRPFLFLLRPNEHWSDTRSRLLRHHFPTTPEREFRSWDWTIVGAGGRNRPIGSVPADKSNNGEETVEDASVILIELMTTGEQLGINRPDPMAVAATRIGGIERSIKIRSSTPTSGPTSVPKSTSNSVVNSPTS